MARDKFHYNVVAALEKEGWEITDDPFTLVIGKKKGEIDIGAERLIGAKREKELILVEVKSFLTQSNFYEFHKALGQYRNYLRMIRILDVNRTLFLAIPDDAFDDLLTDEFGQMTIEEEGLKIIVYSVLENKILQWIK